MHCGHFLKHIYAISWRGRWQLKRCTDGQMDGWMEGRVVWSVVGNQVGRRVSVLKADFECLDSFVGYLSASKELLRLLSKSIIL